MLLTPERTATSDTSRIAAARAASSSRNSVPRASASIPIRDVDPTNPEPATTTPKPSLSTEPVTSTPSIVDSRGSSSSRRPEWARAIVTLAQGIQRRGDGREHLVRAG